MMSRMQEMVPLTHLQLSGFFRLCCILIIKVEYTIILSTMNFVVIFFVDNHKQYVFRILFYFYDLWDCAIKQWQQNKYLVK